MIAGLSEISDARFAIYTADMKSEDKRKYFGAISFTETPLSEVHCLLEIDKRSVNLEPYGLVFIKDRCALRGVNPVLYINNILGDKQKLLSALGSLISTKPEAAAQVLPLLAVFGKKITPPGSVEIEGEVDFRWEREWRYVPAKGPYTFTEADVFIGLCPDKDIPEFDALWQPVEFIDPRRNMKCYSNKLIKARQRFDLKYSVV